ncbi:MAG TPA: M20/M25/M40 family metallo-hydrolase [Victivallales bacterium]|nr:M20/M25/M40 family metallo-hydrolase [Victivallales bacterium]
MFNLENYLCHLEKLVNIDSGTNNKAGIQNIVTYLINLMSSYDFNIEINEPDNKFGPCMIINNGEPPYDILILTHSDTAYSENMTKKWKFSLNDDKAYGPGIGDMKSGLLMACFALIELKKNDKLPKICLAVNSSEEIGSEKTKQWIIDLARKSKSSLVMEMGRECGSFVMERKGWTDVRVDIKGEAMHSSHYPMYGKNAIVEAAKWIVELSKVNNIDLGTTVSPGIISGGCAVNTVAENAFIEINMRYSSNSEKEKIFNKLEELKTSSVENDFKISVDFVTTTFPLVPNDKTKKIASLMYSIGKENGIHVIWKSTAGGSDGNYAAEAEIPIIDALGPVGNLAHTSKEFIYLDSIAPRYTMLTELISSISNIL